jgi:hypothetical protein
VPQASELSGVFALYLSLGLVAGRQRPAAEFAAVGGADPVTTSHPYLQAKLSLAWLNLSSAPHSTKSALFALSMQAEAVFKEQWLRFAALTPPLYQSATKHIIKAADKMVGHRLSTCSPLFDWFLLVQVGNESFTAPFQPDTVSAIFF